MGIEKIVCYVLGHKPKITEGSDFKYICIRCHGLILNLKGFYSIAGMEMYYKENHLKSSKGIESTKNESETIIKK